MLHHSLSTDTPVRGEHHRSDLPARREPYSDLRTE
eukprot:XP_001707759.1 Hypothetical protein GL50803_10133 [Giardia lamblia ATCC 50803]